MRFRYWRMIGALLALALIAGEGSSFAARKKKDKKGTTRLPWKSKLFLDTKPFQTDFGSVKDLKEYMEKNHKAKIGPLGPRLMYEIHFMAFFKKTQPAQIYVLIFLLNAGSAAYTPTLQATIADVLPDETQYTRALSLSRLAYDLENLLSPTLAAVSRRLSSFSGFGSSCTR